MQNRPLIGGIFKFAILARFRVLSPAVATSPEYMTQQRDIQDGEKVK